MRVVALALLVASLVLVAGCRRDKTAVAANNPNATAAQSIEAAARTLGIPIYPGAMPHKTQVAYVVKDEPGGKRYYLLLETPDPAEKVVSFYRNALSARESTIGGTIQLIGNVPAGGSVTVSVGANGRGSGTAFTITAFEGAGNAAAAYTTSFGYSRQSRPVNAAPQAAAPPQGTELYAEPPYEPSFEGVDIDMGPQSEGGTAEDVSGSEGGYPAPTPPPAQEEPEPPAYDEMPPEDEPIDAPPEEEPPPDDAPPGEEGPP